MIVGTGMDLVSIDRLRRFRERHGERGLRRLFTEAELAYCLRQPDPAPFLAVRFAAREAFFKAVGTGWGRGGRWRDVEVEHDPRGAPSLALHGRAAVAARMAGAARVHVSLSHADEVAGAFVVLES